MIDVFFEQFGKEIIHRKAEKDVINQYKNVLPNNLLQFWEKEGWNGYYKGLFWVVNPNDYHGVLEDWIGDTELYKNDSYAVFARTAFGKLYVWSFKKRDYFTIDPIYGTSFDFNDNYPNQNEEDESELTMESFFITSDIEDYDFFDDNEKGLFDKAIEKLGKLKENEMFSFEPALILGGTNTLENLRKVSIMPQLHILSELSKEDMVNYTPNIDVSKLVEDHFREKDKENSKPTSLFDKIKNLFKRN